MLSFPMIYSLSWRLCRNMPAGPEPLLQALAPSREDLVVCVACLLPWYGRADLCARACRPLVLGHALSRKARHGGKAKHDHMAAQNIAGLLRGGLWPQASVSPAEMRAPWDRLRRRRPRMRQRAARWTPGQPTNRQDHWPEIGNTSAYQTHRPGGA